MKNTCPLSNGRVRTFILCLVTMLGSIFLPASLYGQDKSALVRPDTATQPQAAVERTAVNHKQPHPLVVSAFNHSLSLPFKNMLRLPVHPGLMVGTEFCYSKGNHSQLLQTLQLGGFYSRYFGSGLLLSSDLAYRYTTQVGVFGEAMLGVGYLHSFHPRPVYGLNAEGTYQRVTDWGKPSAMGSLSLGLGYDSGKLISPFIRYQWLLQVLYGEALPLVPQGLLHLGVRIKLGKTS